MNSGTINNQPLPKKRPFFIWLIFISYIISAIFTLLSYMLSAFHLTPSLEGLNTIFKSTTVLDYVFEISFTVLNLIGAVWLFQFKRKSYYVFLTVFGLSLIASAYHMLFRDNLFGIPGIGLVEEMLGWLTTIIIIFYIRKYIKQGLLK